MADPCNVIIDWPRWLTLKAAALYSAIGEKRLVELAEDGKVRGFKDPDSKRGDWIFDRLTLDKYRDGQAASVGNIHDKAVDLLKRRRQKCRT